MRYILLFCIALIATGCSTLESKKDFPDVPEPLMSKCGDLDTITKPKVLLSELMKNVINNYTKYHNCADLVQTWQDWYIEQKANSSK